MKLSIIVAMSRNRVIGLENRLPWRLPADLARFKKLTMGHHLLMGRKTYESIGRPLPKRRNIVVTRSGARFEGCETATSLPEAIALARETDDCPFIIGGASLYAEALPIATEVHLTRIDHDYEGDTFFASDLSAFEETESRDGETDGVRFLVLRRKPASGSTR